MFNFNGNTPKKILYNGLNVAKLIYNGVVVWLQAVLTTITGVPPLTLLNVFYSDDEEKYTRLVDYKVYGESVQNGTPTPESPIEIESVGERTKNLLNPSLHFNEPITEYGLTIEYSKEEDCFILNGTPEKTGDRVLRNINIPITKGSNFSISTKYISGAMIRPNENDYTIAYFGAADTINSKVNWNYATLREYDTKKENITCNHDYITTFWFFISGGVTFDNYKVKVQLELGDTATEYEPYGYRIPVKTLGKNKLCIPKETITTTNYSANFTLSNVDSKVKIIGTPYPNYYTYVSINDVFKVELASSACNYIGKVIVEKGNPFVFSWKNENTNPQIKFNYIIFTYADGTFYGANANYDTGYIKQTAKTQDIVNIYIRFKDSMIQQDGEFNDIYSFQVEYGTNVTNYERYIEPITTNIYLNEPLRKIGDYADYIDFEKQKVIRIVKEKVLTGDEYWAIVGSTNNTYFYRTKLAGKGINLVMPPDTTHEGQFCNYLPSAVITTSNTVIGASVYYSESQGFTFFRCRLPQGVVTDTFEQYLKDLYSSGKPMKYYYATTETGEEEIVLPTIPTHKGTNIIEVDTTINPSNMEVTYYAKGVS